MGKPRPSDPKLDEMATALEGDLDESLVAVRESAELALSNGDVPRVATAHRLARHNLALVGFIERHRAELSVSPAPASGDPELGLS